MNKPLIEFKNITKKFGNKTVLDKADLCINRGEITTLIGKSGSGKSVILKHIIGLIEPDEGSILYQGKAKTSYTKAELKKWNAKISYMFQHNALFDSMTVHENISFPLRQTTNLSEEAIGEKVDSIMKQVDLADTAHKYPSELSGGTQKRVALGRALITDPDIVLFDEPTTGQDIVRRNVILSMIAEYQRKFGFTAIVVSHDIPDIFLISNKIMVLYEGKIVFQGSPEEFDDFEHPFIEELVDSLLAFRENLTGLYSLRTFKNRYQITLNRKSPDEKYVIAVMTLVDFGVLCQKLGHDLGQKILQKFGKVLNEYFQDIGAFSTRQKRNVFITFLPFSDLTEAGKLIDNFVSWLHEILAQPPQPSGASPEQDCWIKIQIGLAEGMPRRDALNDIVKAASLNQKEAVSIHLCGD